MFFILEPTEIIVVLKYPRKMLDFSEAIRNLNKHNFNLKEIIALD